MWLIKYFTDHINWMSHWLIKEIKKYLKFQLSDINIFNYYILMKDWLLNGILLLHFYITPIIIQLYSKINKLIANWFIYLIIKLLNSFTCLDLDFGVVGTGKSNLAVAKIINVAVTADEAITWKINL